ncbi:SirB2 family protein [Thiohalobacter sp.]|uniref:SirB2 family protein n=1 Tax=Thiohalobacter sp. TaxID=2025948 RepID=UPI0026196B03|nr:SirB2 family protein [Thiohalobacter sp.]
MDYLLVKSIHVATAVITLALFLLRGLWMWQGSLARRGRWVRVLPHVNDATLLASALALVAIGGHWPWQQPWLAAKLVALLAYIGLGMRALRPGRPPATRRLAFLSALGVFAYIVGVAVRRSPLSWLG